MIKIYIILENALQRLGVQTLVNEYFADIEAEIMSISDLMQNGDGDCMYITDSSTYIIEQDFFTTRKSRCVVLLNGYCQTLTNNSTSVLKIVNSSDSMERIVDNISTAIGHFKSAEGSGSFTNSGEELSSREIQVLTLIVSGAINKEIASQLNISLNTVLTHRKNITTKLGIKTVSGLTLYALMHGYIKG